MVGVEDECVTVPPLFTCFTAPDATNARAEDDETREEQRCQRMPFIAISFCARQKLSVRSFPQIGQVPLVLLLIELALCVPALQDGFG